MRLIEVVLIVTIVVIIAWLVIWGIRQIPDCPAIVEKIIWIAAVVIIIIVMLLRVLGHDIAILRIVN